MSDLQLGLAVIGVGVVAGVIAYNKWQEARLQRRAERHFGSRHNDALMDEGATASDAATPLAPSPAPEGFAETGVRVEHTIDDIDVPAPRPAPAPRQETAPGRIPLDPLVDCIVELDCARAATGSDVLAQARQLVDAGILKPVHWEGFDAASSHWEALDEARRYSNLRAGLQLATRAGPATADELGTFFEAIQEIALALAAQPGFPDADEALERARQLDAFCADADVQIGLNVISTATTMFAGTKLRALAESGGLALGRDGRFHRTDDHGAELFTLANMEPMPFHPETLKTLATRGVTVLLDVPRAPGASSTFRLYLDFARQLEQALGGMLVDDNTKPIGQASLEAIGTQLERIHRSMEAHGIPAGGALAQRLFS